MAGGWRSTSKSHIDRDMVDKLIVRNELKTIDLAKTIFGGNCPFCGNPKTFLLWAETGGFRCFWCGCDGRFVRTPERTAQERQERARVALGG